MIPVPDERDDTYITDEELRSKILARKQAEAEADVIDEKVKMAVLTGAAFAVVGVIVTLMAGLAAVFRDPPPEGAVGIMTAGAIIGLVGGGVVSAAQAGMLFGRKSSE